MTSVELPPRPTRTLWWAATLVSGAGLATALVLLFFEVAARPDPGTESPTTYATVAPGADVAPRPAASTPDLAPASDTLQTVQPSYATVAQPPQAKRPPSESPNPAPSATGLADGERLLLHRYQRVGHSLQALERRLGYVPTADLMAQFREIDITSAMKTRRSRQRLAAVLQQIENAIERNQAIEISAECLNNTLAAGCR